MRALKSRWRCSDKADKPAVQTVVGLVMTKIRMVMMTMIRMMMMMMMMRRRRSRMTTMNSATAIMRRSEWQWRQIWKISQRS